MKNILLLFLIVFLFTGAKCRKDKNSSVLPPITQEGKNTIGFKVNGEVWAPYYECQYFGFPCGEISARYGLPDAAPDYFDLKVSRSNDRSSLMINSFVPITSTGNKCDSVYIKYTGKGLDGVTREWTKSSFNNIPGNLEVTRIDPVNQIISGIFSFKLYSTFNGITDSINITEGRFDFKMNACICR